jgi:hypothetical protein
MSEYNPSILAEQLPTGMAEWIKQNTYFAGMIVTVNDYLRLDTPVLEMTSVNVWLNDLDLKTKIGWATGLLNIDIVFNLNKARSDRMKEIHRVINSFTGQLLFNPVMALKFISNNYVPGLQFLTTKTKINYRNILEQLKNGRGDTTITIQLAYEINIRQNQDALWSKGFDFYSTKDRVYYPMDNIELEVNINSIKEQTNA